MNNKIGIRSVFMLLLAMYMLQIAITTYRMQAEINELRSEETELLKIVKMSINTDEHIINIIKALK